jgi:hypothetical protein
MDPRGEDVEVGLETGRRQEDQPDEDRRDEADGEDDQVGGSDGAGAVPGGGGRRVGRGRVTALYRRMEAQ